MAVPRLPRPPSSVYCICSHPHTPSRDQRQERHCICSSYCYSESDVSALLQLIQQSISENSNATAAACCSSVCSSCCNSAAAACLSAVCQLHKALNEEVSASLFRSSTLYKKNFISALRVDGDTAGRGQQRETIQRRAEEVCAS